MVLNTARQRRFMKYNTRDELPLPDFLNPSAASEVITYNVLVTVFIRAASYRLEYEVKQNEKK